jgi:hypothetical protein
MASMDEYNKHLEMYFSKIADNFERCRSEPYYLDVPTFYYMGVGSANNSNSWPEPSSRQELPDYVMAYPYFRKVIILIDYHSGIPLYGSGHELVLIEKSDITNNKGLPLFEYYHSTEQNQFEKPILELYVVRQYLNILQEYNYNAESKMDMDINTNSLEIKQPIHIIHRNALQNLVENALSSNSNSLFLVNSFSGYPNHLLTDEMLSLFPYEKQEDIRGRFLLEGSYNADYGCFYDLTKPENQPIIENGRFYNPGSLSIVEFNDELRKILELSNSKNSFVLIKKKIMIRIFKNLLEKTFNQDYRTLRCAINEMKKSDPEIIPFLRSEMLLFVEKILQAIHSFVNIASFIEKQRYSDIYSDESEIKKLVSEIIGIRWPHS